MDDQEFATSVLYRLAYGIAADRVEASEAEVLARLGATDPAARETIRQAVADALAGRRPRW